MIPLLLAEAAPSLLKEWLEVFAWLAGLIACVMWIWTMARPAKDGVPQPLEVKKHGGVATADDLREVHGRIKREREEIDKDIDNLRDEMRASAEKLDRAVNSMRLEIKADNHGLHERINEVLSAVSELRGRLVR